MFSRHLRALGVKCGLRKAWIFQLQRKSLLKNISLRGLSTMEVDQQYLKRKEMSQEEKGWGDHRAGTSDTFNRNKAGWGGGASTSWSQPRQQYSSAVPQSQGPTNEYQESKDEKETGDFQRFNLPDQTVKLFRERNITYLFPIQASTYHHAYKAKDIVGRALTGTGKTLSFALPIVERLRAEKKFRTGKTAKVVVLAPTRELAIQVADEFIALKHSKAQYNVTTIYGGVPYESQERAFKEGVDVLVGTVGRVNDHIERRNLRLSDIEAFVLDEADQMLNMGFKDDVEKILNFAKRESGSERGKKNFQIMLYSATIPDWVQRIARDHLDENYVNVDLVKNLKNKTASAVQHLAISCPYYNRPATIADVLLCYGGKDKKSIVFTQTKAEANELLQNGNIKINIDVLHGDIPQPQREVTMKRFRQGTFQALVATDVAARGLDISNVDLIVQTEPPKDYETYIHRSGRTARAGNAGTCITFYTAKQKNQLQFIEYKAGVTFQKIGAPQPKDIITASSRDIKNSLDKVSDDVLPFFEDLADKIIDNIGAKKALCKALAVMSGNLKKIENRSLLTGGENQVTYQITLGQEIQSPSYVWGILRREAPEVSDQIRNMKLLASSKGVIFDVPEEVLTQFERKIVENSRSSYSRYKCERLYELPELVDQDRGGYGGGRRGDYGGSSWNRSNSNSSRYSGGSSNGNWGNGWGRGAPRPTIQSGQSSGGYLTSRGPGRSDGWRGQGLDSSSNGGSGGGSSIFIGNLPYSATEEKLSDWLSHQGVSLKRINILKDADGKSKGIGFADLADSRDLDKALKFNKSMFDGRAICIEKSNRK